VRELGSEVAERFAPVIAALAPQLAHATVTAFVRVDEAALALELPGLLGPVPTVEHHVGTVHVTAQGAATLLEVLVPR
jgi:hypothetical protein